MQFEPAPLAVQLGVPIAPNVPWVGAVPIANVNDGLSMSLAASVIVNGVSSGVVGLWAFETGGSFTGVIVRLTVATLESETPSCALNVKLSDPL